MEFILPISIEKFRSTNAAWNDLMLNDPWSVGYVTTLIELIPFEKKEDWELYYYKSGEDREAKIQTLKPEFQDILNNESLIRVNRGIVNSLPFELKNINTQYGRTKEGLIRKADILYNSLKTMG